MASVDKTSVRKQVEELREQFQKLSETGKLSDKTIFLFQSLFTIVNIILSVFMEKPS